MITKQDHFARNKQILESDKDRLIFLNKGYEHFFKIIHAKRVNSYNYRLKYLPNLGFNSSLSKSFNRLIHNNNLDKIGGLPEHGNRKCQILLNNLMGEWGLHDFFRIQNSSNKTFTHYNKRCRTGTRLDYFLVDSSMINLPTCKSTISHGFRSDHSYVSLIVEGHNFL